jgi:hypothetical protein
MSVAAVIALPRAGRDGVSFFGRAAIALACILLAAAVLPATASAGAGCPTESDHSVLEALPVVLGTPREHTGGGGYHYSSFEGVAGHSYVIDGAILSQPDWSNLSVWLEDESGTMLGFDNGSQTYGTQIRYLAPETRTYYLRTLINWGFGTPPVYTLRLSDIPQSSISGTARDMTTGLPLPNIDVSLVQDRFMKNTIEIVTETTRTASDGSYRFEVLWPARCTAQFSDPTGAREGEFYGASMPEQQTRRVDTPWTGADITGIDGKLGLPWTLQARLVDAVTREPLPGARLLARVMNPGSNMGYWTDDIASGSDGQVVMSFSARSEAFPRIAASSGVYPMQYLETPGSPGFSGSLHAAPGTTMTVDIPVRRGGGIVLRMRDRRTGAVRPALQVRLERKDAFHISIFPPAWGETNWVTWEDAGVAETASDGTVSFAALAPGLYRAYVWGSDNAAYSQWVGDPGSGTGDGAMEFAASPMATTTSDAFLALPDDKVAPTVKLTSTAPTSLAAGASFALAGDVLWNAEGVPGETMRLEVSGDGVSWSDSGVRAVTGPQGHFAFSPRPTIRTYYRVSLSAGWWNLAARSGVVSVRPRATTSASVAPSAARRSHSFSVYGYVAPKHASGTYLVTLNFYLRNAHGAYVYHHHVHARRSYYSSTRTKYKATVSLPHRGKWRVRAYHSDAGHSPSYSGYDYITVR